MLKRQAVLIVLLLAGCSKVPGGSDMPEVAGKAAAGVAFAYGYAFELPSRSIGALQEAHAAACERAGRSVCRITGLSYRVDRDGQASATLAVKVAAPVARRFGHNAVAAADGFGATLVGADISGEEVAGAIASSESARRTADADTATIDRALRDPRLSAAERTRLRDQRAALVAAARADAQGAAEQADRLANTPMAFSYATGHGVGLANALRDSADAALGSTRLTLIGATWLLATLGPPALLLLFLWLGWRRWGRSAWRRLSGLPAA